MRLLNNHAMAPNTTKHPPQTLKQAKRAYQKSGPRLSEIEIRRIERAAELQDRAARMREREHKRKANLKRKAERDEKDREARRRMNIPEPVKGFYVGPSQIKMSGFLDTGVKSDKEDTKSEIGDRKSAEPEAKREGLQIAGIEVPAAQTARTETPPSPKPGSFDHPVLPMAPPKLRMPLEPRSANSIVRSKPLFFAESVKSSFVIEDDWDSILASGTQIARELAAPDLGPNIHIVAPPSVRPCVEIASDDIDFLDIISTQDLDDVAEESLTKPSMPEQEPIYSDCPKERHISDKAKNQTENKIGGPDHENSYKSESDYSEDAAYNPNQGAEHNNEPPSDIDAIIPVHPPTGTTKDSEFDDGIKDDEFNDIIAVCETKRAPLPKNIPIHTPHITHTSNKPEPPKAHLDTNQYASSDYGDFDLSTQEMLELEPVCSTKAPWPELSTQQLYGLEESFIEDDYDYSAL